MAEAQPHGLATRAVTSSNREAPTLLGKARSYITVIASAGLCLSKPLLVHFPMAGKFAGIMQKG